MTKPETSKKIIIATAVLHNIAVSSGMPVPQNTQEIVQVVAEEPVFDVPDEPTGRAVRNRVIQQWF